MVVRNMTKKTNLKMNLLFLAGIFLMVGLALAVHAETEGFCQNVKNINFFCSAEPVTQSQCCPPPDTPGVNYDGDGIIAPQSYEDCVANFFSTDAEFTEDLDLCQGGCCYSVANRECAQYTKGTCFLDSRNEFVPFRECYDYDNQGMITAFRIDECAPTCCCGKKLVGSDDQPGTDTITGVCDIDGGVVYTSPGSLTCVEACQSLPSCNQTCGTVTGQCYCGNLPLNAGDVCDAGCNGNPPDVTPGAENSIIGGVTFCSSLGCESGMSDCRCGNIDLDTGFCCAVRSKRYFNQIQCQNECIPECLVNEPISKTATTYPSYSACWCDEAKVAFADGGFCCNGVYQTDSCYREATITGHVFAAESEQSLYLAQILAKGKDRFAVSQKDGSYTLRIPIPEGGEQVTLTAKKTGFSPEEQKVTLTAPGVIVENIDFYLEPLPGCEIDFQFVCTTGSTDITLFWDNPAECPTPPQLFELKRDGVFVTSFASTDQASFSYTDTGLQWNTLYTYELKVLFEGGTPQFHTLTVNTGSQNCAGVLGEACEGTKRVFCGKNKNACNQFMEDDCAVHDPPSVCLGPNIYGTTICKPKASCEDFGNPYGVFYSFEACYGEPLASVPVGPPPQLPLPPPSPTDPGNLTGNVVNPPACPWIVLTRDNSGLDFGLNADEICQNEGYSWALRARRCPDVGGAVRDIHIPYGNGNCDTYYADCFTFISCEEFETLHTQDTDINAVVWDEICCGNSLDTSCCGGSTPTCSSLGGTCGGIANIACCAGTGLVCYLDGDYPDASGTCVLQEEETCETSDDCTSEFWPFCSPETHHCVQCLKGGDCGEGGTCESPGVCTYSTDIVLYENPCYYDASKTNIDKCYACGGVSCSTYRSEGACTIDNCMT
ncbi:hypothetical protein COY95_01475, partial [Candidatus Woesearchaeota archaeon CG_4_10_14_0_8_um_filter_47_5]